jgi:3-(3-hydroxy-phenyl)propionate hydroxylase
MADLGLHQPWLVFDVRLKPAECRACRCYTVQHCDPARPMTYVQRDRQPPRRWEIMLMPGDDPAEMVQPERTLALVVALAAARAGRDRTRGDLHLPLGDRPGLAARPAAAGRRRRPPDAALPRAGHVRRIRDAANLAWKLDAVACTGAPTTLLDTYESERAPHVRAFIDLAVRLGGIIQTTDMPDAA